ncbi:hypothetical protein PRIO_3796 [Paenibacillus riograndensis SBR5]|uniref:Uncharacterized protein n=1 Tax=Paenibacillus riograndensis SBR5 TaxID=1073571 RepID=A0A0E4CXB7_9BACL|nr:hypothetical protein PRIO_3796 [Paenibacillus riograndensis SBR5]
MKRPKQSSIGVDFFRIFTVFVTNLSLHIHTC